MTDRPTGRRSLRRPGPTRLAVVVFALLGVTACQSTPGPAPATASARAPAGGATSPTEIEAIRTTLDALNATAGGPVADQQAQLIAHVEPDRRDEVRRCPPATTTVRLEPVDQGLRALPEPSTDPAAVGSDATDATDVPDTGIAPDPGSTTFALPALIRIFSGDRLVGTDLTTLRMVVRDTSGGGEAYLTPFCVN